MNARGTVCRVLPFVLVAAAVAIFFAACTPEEKVVRYKPFLANLKPALGEGMTLKYNEEPVVGDPRVTPPSPSDAKGEAAIDESPDGKKKLVAHTPAHVMQLVERCLDENEDRLLLDQMVAESTKEYFRAQGKDPIGFVEDLHAKRKDIAKLFSRMPQGENSPTVILHQLPDRVWRIELIGGYAKDMRFTRLWVQMEKGQWRLMWVD